MSTISTIIINTLGPSYQSTVTFASNNTNIQLFGSSTSSGTNIGDGYHYLNINATSGGVPTTGLQACLKIVSVQTDSATFLMNMTDQVGFSFVSKNNLIASATPVGITMVLDTTSTPDVLLLTRSGSNGTYSLQLTSAGSFASAHVYTVSITVLGGAGSGSGSIGNSFSPYGDGVEGNVTITGGTPSFTYNRYINNLTISSGAIVSAKGFRILVNGTLTIEDTSIITIAGTAGSGSVAGTGGGSVTSFYGPGANGGTGGAGAGGNPGSAALLSSGGAGGSGGTPTPGAGGTAGASGELYFFKGHLENDAVDSTNLPYNSGGGGGGGGGAAAGGAGGGGGGGGGIMIIGARTIITTGWTGQITAAGGAGGNGSGTGAAGGGGGGGGGVCIIMSSTNVSALIGTQILGSGGAGGSGLNGGGTGGTGVKENNFQCWHNKKKK